MAINTNYAALNNAILGSISSVYNNAASRLNNAALGKNSSSTSSSLSGWSNNTINTTTRDYVANIKSAASDMGDALKTLTSKSPKNDVFGQRVAVSSDEKAISAEMNGSVTYGKIADTSVDVQQLATTQKNEGAALKSDTQLGVSGYYQFQVDAGGKQHQVSFEVNASDTTKTMQEKMAKAINDRGIGLTASVSTDKAAGTSRLVIESKNTGEDAAFSLSDISGNAVAATAASRVSQESQDAIYRQDGVEKSSASNTVDLKNGITATLKQETEGAVTISASYDASKAEDEVRSLVASYNELLSVADSASGIRGADRLRSELGRVASAYGGSLSRVGITKDSSGYLSVNNDKLSAAAESGALKNLFQTDGASSSRGLAGRLSKISDEVSRNPAQFVSGMSFANQSALGLLNTGLIFDFMV